MSKGWLTLLIHIQEVKKRSEVQEDDGRGACGLD